MSNVSAIRNNQKPVLKTVNAGKPKLFDQMREALRSRHYSRRTEQTYCLWIKRFIHFHHLRHPMECLRLRVQDIDFSRCEILVRDGKGAKDRIMIYTHVLNKGGHGVCSPMDAL